MVLGGSLHFSVLGRIGWRSAVAKRIGINAFRRLPYARRSCPREIDWAHCTVIDVVSVIRRIGAVVYACCPDGTIATTGGTTANSCSIEIRPLYAACASAGGVHATISRALRCGLVLSRRPEPIGLPLRMAKSAIAYWFTGSIVRLIALCLRYAASPEAEWRYGSGSFGKDRAAVTSEVAQVPPSRHSPVSKSLFK